MPTPGKVFWSAKARNFYQEGRRGAISREAAAQHVKYNEASGRFIDERGRFVPNRTFEPLARKLTTYVSRDKEGSPFLSTVSREETISSTLAKELLSTRQVRNNEQIVVTDVWTDGKGNVFRTHTSTVLGGRTSVERLDEQADRRMRGQAWEKAQITSGKWKKRNHLSRTYSVKRIQKPQLSRAA